MWGAKLILRASPQDDRYHRLMPRAFVLLALLLSVSANAQTIVWDKYDPMAVRTDRTSNVALENRLF